MKKAIIYVAVTLLLAFIFIVGGIVYASIRNPTSVPTPPGYATQRLEELFDTIEDELERFVVYLGEKDLVETLGGVNISFHTDREQAERVLTASPRDRERLVFYGGGLVEEATAPRIIELLAYDKELYDVFRVISERNVISLISITPVIPSESVFRMQLHIHGEKTQFISTSASFRYVHPAIDPERDPHIDTRIRDNWYIFITPW